MTDKATFEMISRRRAFSLLGLAAAIGLAASTTALVSDAEAETAGMERRKGRRTGRHERREGRRTGREERRGAAQGSRDAARGAVASFPVPKEKGPAHWPVPSIACFSLL
jgi:hypothetical protein